MFPRAEYYVDTLAEYQNTLVSRPSRKLWNDGVLVDYISLGAHKTVIMRYVISFIFIDTVIDIVSIERGSFEKIVLKWVWTKYL